MEHIQRVWDFPPYGWVKVNVHSDFLQNAPDGKNRNGIGVVIIDEIVHLLKLTYGTIPRLTNLNSALWAILVGMRRAFQDEYSRIITETDNVHAYSECKYYTEEGITSYTRHTFRFILSRLKDENIRYDLKLVHPQRNRVARRLATLGRETMHDMQTFGRPIANIQEVLNIDPGLGQGETRFQDVIINDFELEEPHQDGQVVQF